MTKQERVLRIWGTEMCSCTSAGFVREEACLADQAVLVHAADHPQGHAALTLLVPYCAAVVTVCLQV